MIKAILMIYVFIPSLILNLFNDSLELRAICSGVAFASGMFCFYFISEHARKICKPSIVKTNVELTQPVNPPRSR